MKCAERLFRRFNELYAPVLVEPEALVGDVPRLVGLDGKLKMSKSYGNAIYLSESYEEIMKKVRNAVTDPNRIKKSDPGNPDICTVFSYQGIFNKEDKCNIEEMCKGGKIGCVECKRILGEKINEFISPFREKRAYYESHPKVVDEILLSGTNRAREIAKETMREVRAAMKINYFD